MLVRIKSVDWDNVSSCLGCLVEILIVLAIFVGLPLYKRHRNDAERAEKARIEREDSIRAAHIRDSIEHTPAYLDSVRLAKEERVKKEADWERQRKYAYQNDIIGFWYVGDCIYHTHFSCGFCKEDIANLRFITHEIVDKKDLIECDECLYGWIETDMVSEYITEHYSTSEIIDMFDITLSDLE